VRPRVESVLTKLRELGEKAKGFEVAVSLQKGAPLVIPLLLGGVSVTRSHTGDLG